MTAIVKDQVVRDLERLCCPSCRHGIVPGGAIWSCPGCGRLISRLAEGLTSFLTVEETTARAVLDWPPEFVEALAGWASDDDELGHLPAGFREQLAHYSLIGPDGRLTPLGAGVQYHVTESRWQAACQDRDGLLALTTGRPRTRVLDIGCGAAQTLRLLTPSGPAELVGVDSDLTALALGRQFAQLEGIPISLAGAAADSLPFPDESFDLVLCRVALNYMHQRRALAEMVRVLVPGGWLYLRVERIWYDAYLIARAQTARALACRTRDLGHGMVHALTGRQVTPGGPMRGGRAFASAGRLARMLGTLGCRIVRVAETLSCPRILGRRTQLTIVASRGPMGS